MPASPSDKSSYTTENERLPEIVSPPATAFRHHNGSTHTFQLKNNISSPTPTKKYITKTMNTKTTIKTPGNDSPVVRNGTSSQSLRTTSSESKVKLR